MRILYTNTYASIHTNHVIIPLRLEPVDALGDDYGNVK
jgi:hypothetical protein